MSDSALTTSKFTAYTTTYLRERIQAQEAGYVEIHPDTLAMVRAEVDRRERAASGEFEAMTTGERLRRVRAEMAEEAAQTRRVAGREHIAKLADADGEHQFAREVRAGCWDHRNDVAAAIASA